MKISIITTVFLRRILTSLRNWKFLQSNAARELQSKQQERANSSLVGGGVGIERCVSFAPVSCPGVCGTCRSSGNKIN
jgi:hypothetical protein